MKRKVNQWRSFEEARMFVHSLGLKSEKEWRVARKINLPEDIPTNPNRTYADEWNGMGDWLGTGSIADKDRLYLTFEEAALWAQQSGISSTMEWRLKAKEGRIPENIPKVPYNTYHKQWTTWGAFLGTGFVHYRQRAWRSYDESRTWARDSGIFTRDEWEIAAKSKLIPDDIPNLPHNLYTEWEGWPAFFGRDIRGGSSAVEHIFRHELSNFVEIDDSVRIIENKRIDIVLKHKRVVIEYDGYHWHKHLQEKDRLDNELFTFNGWRIIRIREKPLNSISADDVIVSPRNRIFERICTTLLHLVAIGVISDDKSPEIDAYIDNGQLMMSGDIISNILGWRKFSDAREWAHTQGLSGEKAWRILRKSNGLPSDIPSTPNIVYENDWQGWGDFLGTGNKYIPPGQWIPFEEARDWGRKSGIKQAREWKSWNMAGRLPKGIPGKPDSVYSDKWISWNDWLSSGCEWRQRKPWVSFEEVCMWARDNGIKTEKAWRQACKNGIVPELIPHSPPAVYREFWQGWGPFLDKRKVEGSTLQIPNFKKVISQLAAGPAQNLPVSLVLGV